MKGLTKRWLWPHNSRAVKIDRDYYDALPPVPYVEGMKEYVKMFPWQQPVTWSPWKTDRNSIVLLASYDLENDEEIEHFARAVEKHCCGKIISTRSFPIVAFHVYSISAKWDDKHNCFVFANWA